jgi:hypothetical protein
MLKRISIGPEIKQVLIVTIFAFLLVETLTSATIAFVILGGALILLGKIPGPFIRNLMSLGIFAIYWGTYGKIIDPEVGLNFLTSIIVIKMLEKESRRDNYMIFFGLLLLISAGSLFQKNIMYVFFFGVSFFILIQDFYSFLKLPSGPVSLFKNLLWILPITAFFFFFAPRLLNPFQIESSLPKDGEIGYTPDLNVSAIEALSSNDRIVFRAVVMKQLASGSLYWRGNTIIFTDGWNWNSMPEIRPQTDVLLSPLKKNQFFEQSIRTFSRQDFFFGLDYPAIISTKRGVTELGESRTLSQKQWEHQFRYTVYSELGSDQLPTQMSKKMIRTGLRPEDKKWIHQTFRSDQLPELTKEIQRYFQKENFSFSLSPGRVSSFGSFMQDKKIGFCSHYASALALILRTKNIHSRLVSGFLGGSYNKFAGFYQITQNDAHVWVEAFHEGKWLRLDPTTWVAPDRISLGGEAFLQKSNSFSFISRAFNSNQLEWFRNLQQWFIQWDFKFNTWLDELDYYGQDALLERLKLKREWVMRMIPAVLIIFILLYGYFISREKRKISKSEYLWQIFHEKMKKKGLHLSLFSIKEIDEKLEHEGPKVNEVWNDLIRFSYSTRSIVPYSELKKKIQSL